MVQSVQRGGKRTQLTRKDVTNGSASSIGNAVVERVVPPYKKRQTSLGGGTSLPPTIPSKTLGLNGNSSGGGIGGGIGLPPTLSSKTLGMTTRLATTTLGANVNSSGGGIGSNPSRSSSNLNVTTRVAPTPSLGMNINSSEPSQRSSTYDDTYHNSVEVSRGSTNSHASDAGNSAPKKTRGFSREIKTSTIMLTSGKRIEIHLDEDLGVPMGQVRNISSLLSHECGYQVRNHVPLLQEHWDDIDEDTMQKLIDGVTTNFDIDTKDPRWYKYIYDNMRNRYNDYKYKLAKYYKSCESDEAAQENPPLKLLREREIYQSGSGYVTIS